MRINYIDEKKTSLLSQGSIIAGRLAPYFLIPESTEIDNNIKEIADRFSEELDSRIIVSDLNGKVIVDSKEEMKGERLNNEAIALALLGKSIAKQETRDNHTRVMNVATPITQRGRIVGSIFISSSLEDIYLSIKSTMQKFMILSLFSLIITGLISFIFADIIASPIEKLTDAVKKMAQGKINQKVRVAGNDEISNLGRAFNLMTTKLEQVDKQRRDFVANVSHELRTPMSSIKILSGTLVHQKRADDKVYKEFLKDIDSEVDRLNKIIDDLLKLVDLEKENLDLDYKITYVNYLINRVVMRLKPLADKKHIDLSFVERNKIQIMLDQSKIHQSLINIIGNAIKYTPEKGKVTIDLYSEQEEVIIKVKDSGIGIPKEDLPFIFDRFYRVDKARARNTGGSGLGLAITQQIIALHQGRITVESEVAKGTTVYIILPKNALI